MLKITHNKSIFSNLSILFSSVCVLHCMMTPVLILLLPTLSEFFSETVELVLVMAILPLSLAGFIPTWARHKNYSLLRIFLFGLSFVIFSQLFIHTPHENLATQSSVSLGPTYIKSIIMFIGAAFVAFAVYKNNKHTHVCHHKH